MKTAAAQRKYFSLSASERAECRALGQPAKATLEAGDDPVDCRVDEPDNTKAWLLFSIGSGCLVLGNVVIGRSLRDLGQLTDEIYAAEAAHHEPPVSIGDPQH